MKLKLLVTFFLIFSNTLVYAVNDKTPDQGGINHDFERFYAQKMQEQSSQPQAHSTNANTAESKPASEPIDYNERVRLFHERMAAKRSATSQSDSSSSASTQPVVAKSASSSLQDGHPVEIASHQVPTTNAPTDDDSSSNSHQCFEAGTLVFTPDYEKPFKPIESLVVGDLVWSCNTVTDQCVQRRTVETFLTEETELVWITTRNERGAEHTVKATLNHPFYLDKELTTIHAQELKPKDKLWSYEEGNIEITQVELKKMDHPISVFNLRVEAQEGDNNYFVGEHLILVHNCNLRGAAEAVVNTAGPTCAASATTCVAGLGATALATGVAVGSGGSASIILPSVGGVTAAACTTAGFSCGIAGAAVGMQNFFSKRNSFADVDSAGQSGEGKGEKVSIRNPFADVDSAGQDGEAEGGQDGIKGYVPRDATGKPLDAEKDTTGHVKPLSDQEHSVLGKATGRKVGEYKQAFEFGKDGEMKQRQDFTDHGRPQNHTNPHTHKRTPNPTGGTAKWDK